MSIIKNIKLSLLALAAVTVLMYGTTLFNGFVWDDFNLILEDPIIQKTDITQAFSLDHWKNIPAAERARFRPVRVVSFIVDHLIYGNAPFGYHLTNLLLHMGNVLLVYLVALVLFKDATAAFIAGLLFSIHPVHGESVSWVKNRSDLLCSLFMLSSLLALLRLAGVRRMIVVTVLFVAAVLSKEIGFMAPLLALGVVLIYGEKQQRTKDLIWLGICNAVVAGFFIAKQVLWKNEMVLQTGLVVDAYIQMRIVLYTLSTYANMLLFPANLNPEHYFNMYITIPQAISVGFVVFAVIGVLLYAGYKLYKQGILPEKYHALMQHTGFGYMLMVLTIVPVSNIVFLESRPIAEQRLYIPSIGFVFMVGVLLSAFLRKAANEKALIPIQMGSVYRWGYNSMYGMLVVAVLALGTYTVQRNFIWKDEFSFWKETVRLSPTHYRANFNLGIMYLKQENIEKAAQYFAVASMDCDDPEVFYNLACCYDALGKYGEALMNYDKVIVSLPNVHPDVYNNIGVVHEKAGNAKKAREYYEKALAMDASNKPARFNLAQLYEKQGKIKRARQEYTDFMRVTRNTYDRQEAKDKLQELVKR